MHAAAVFFFLLCGVVVGEETHITQYTLNTFSQFCLPEYQTKKKQEAKLTKIEPIKQVFIFCVK